MPLLTALASSVVEHGRRMAARSSPGRLDPPITLVLDDVAALAPLPELPALMAEGPPGPPRARRPPLRGTGPPPLAGQGRARCLAERHIPRGPVT